MNTVEMLDELQNKALHDEELKNKFLKTKEEEDSPSWKVRMISMRCFSPVWNRRRF